MRRQSGLITRRGGVAGLVNEYTGHNMIFPGHLNYTAASVAPPGWLAANGAAISRTVYGSLFAAIGTTFGAGDGSTTFNLPDLRGEFLRGWDNGRGVDSGRARGSSQADDVKSHQHEMHVSGKYSAGAAGGMGAVANSSGTASSNPTGTTGGSETRPRNVAQLAIIKY